MAIGAERVREYKELIPIKGHPGCFTFRLLDISPNPVLEVVALTVMSGFKSRDLSSGTQAEKGKQPK